MRGLPRGGAFCLSSTFIAVLIDLGLPEIVAPSVLTTHLCICIRFRDLEQVAGATGGFLPYLSAMYNNKMTEIPPPPLGKPNSSPNRPLSRNHVLHVCTIPSGPTGDMSLMRMLSPVLGGPSSGKQREPKDIRLRVRLPS